MMSTFRHFINGSWVEPQEGSQADQAIDLFDPATEAFRCRLPLAGIEDVTLATTAARNAFDAGWHASRAQDRLAILHDLMTQIEYRRDAFARAISSEMGAPIDFSRTHQVDAALGHLRATAAAVTDNAFDQPFSPTMPEHRVRYEPIGVAALITPWNWPLNQISLKVGAALIAGCTIVLKPSELAPQSGMLFGECMEATGAPDGVFNLLIGGAETGRVLTEDARVDIISFTGSTRAGKSVALAAAETFKRTTLELGGKSPNLLFADCDIETAVRQGIAHCFRNSGQSCNAASRMLVEHTIYDDVVELAAQIAGEYTSGLPNASGAHLGPLVSRPQFEKVQNFIQKGMQDGAKLVAGGLERPEGLSTGFFVQPTVFADVTPDMTIAREEIFGPVLCIGKFTSMDDAIGQANDCKYGLAAYVQTKSQAIADRAAQRLQAGMIQVNGTSRAPGAPFGGIKASGVGREAGIWGIRAFQEIKSISGVSRIA